MLETKVAILIPVYNEGVVIKDTVKSLLDADCDRCDIFIVDDKSTDDTAALAKSTGVNVVTAPKNGGKAAAQRFALEHFNLVNRYDWIICLDGDTKVCPAFFNVMYEKANSAHRKVGLYVGQVKSVKNDHFYSASRAADYALSHDLVKEGQSNFNVVFVSPGCASMYRAEVLRHLHIDSATLAEDMDLTMQVHELGMRVEYVADAVVHTQDPNSFSNYHKQILRWSRGFWQVFLKHEVFRFKKKVDWYIAYMVLDSLIFNRVFLLIFLLIVSPSNLLLGVTSDMVLSFLVSVYGAYKTKRTDLIYKFPLTYPLSYVNFYAYIRAFYEIVVQRKEILAWNKVDRYQFE